MESPILVFDDDCGFCTWWARFFAARSDLTIVGFSDLSADLHDRLPSDYERCSHVVLAEQVYSCGASMEEAFRRSTIGWPFRALIGVLRRSGTYVAVRERAYRSVSRDRALWGRLFSTTPPAREHDDPNDEG